MRKSTRCWIVFLLVLVLGAGKFTYAHDFSTQFDPASKSPTVALSAAQQDSGASVSGNVADPCSDHDARNSRGAGCCAGMDCGAHCAVAVVPWVSAAAEDVALGDPVQAAFAAIIKAELTPLFRPPQV